MFVEKTEQSWPARPDRVEYPDSDGRPAAGNTLQFDWILLLKTNLDLLVPDFVAGDLLWYPVKGDPKTRVAPDALVAFGRPKGYRGSYKQWEEEGVPPAVVFEVLSPGNRYLEMVSKLRFYERYGVDEYYVIDPYENGVVVYVRENGILREVEDVAGFKSPRLGIRFVVGQTGLEVLRPDGQAFRSFEQVERAEEAANLRAEGEKRRADEERLRAEEAKRRADALAAKLRELGVNPEEF